ncbi:MAG TPA: hypothetical protein VJ850_08540 [Candidatus Limnocylindrales bacterium]|nr:hypothetical protein [Candidatus Limnocylindrales bacterium]
MLDFLALAVVGVGMLIGSAIAASALNLGQPPNASAFIVTGLTLTALLLVPASIYVAALGAMFPSFDPATPVSLIGSWPRRIFRLAMVTLGFGVAAAGLDAFGVPIGPIATSVFVVLVGVGLVDAVWLLDVSLLIINPDRLGQMLADRALRPRRVGPLGRPSDTEVEQIFDDLARLARELGNRGRPTAASHAIDHLTDIRAAFGGRLSQRAVGRADGIVAALASKHHDLATSAERYRAATQA